MQTLMGSHTGPIKAHFMTLINEFSIFCPLGLLGELDVGAGGAHILLPKRLTSTDRPTAARMQEWMERRHLLHPRKTSLSRPDPGK